MNAKKKNNPQNKKKQKKHPKNNKWLNNKEMLDSFYIQLFAILQKQLFC